jgi:hypothetical protein
MLVTIKINGYSSFELALVHWYDFCYKNDVRRLYKYDCPLLQTTNTYNFVPVESIIELIQVVKRAEKQNEYFVNIYMF